MNFRALNQLFSLRDLRSAVMGFGVVVGGMGLTGLMYYAHLTQHPRLLGISAGISLVFVLLILIFVVPPLARNASKEASQLNLPFEFTAGGAIMLGLIVIVGFSAWNSGNNLLFLIISFLTASMFVGFAAGNFCLKKLDVKMRFPETIFAGQETPILVSIHNRKRLFPSFSVVAEVRGKERERSIALDDLQKILPQRLAERFGRAPVVRRTLSYFVYVPRNETSENRSSHTFEHRGRFLIKDFELSTHFPFGFFRHRRRLAAKETELIIFPKFNVFEGDLDALPLEAGKLVANKRGSGQDLLALREYQPNDDLRRIDWKATARARHLIVREFSAEDEKRVTIYLDIRVPSNGEKPLTIREKIELENTGKQIVKSDRFEKGVSQTAALAAYFCDERAEVRLITAGKKGEFGTGTGHLYETLKRLALIEPTIVDDVLEAGIEKSIAEIFEEVENSHNILITATDNPGYAESFAAETSIIRY